MERVGCATRLRQGYGVPSMEAKVTRVGARSEPDLHFREAREFQVGVMMNSLILQEEVHR
jgi:hypothetical protein